jgi:hypothetical protein
LAIISLSIIFYCGFDGVFGEDTAVDFDWGEAEFVGNMGVFNGCCFIQCFTLDPVCDKT